MKDTRLSMEREEARDSLRVCWSYQYAKGVIRIQTTLEQDWTRDVDHSHKLQSDWRALECSMVDGIDFLTHPMRLTNVRNIKTGAYLDTLVAIETGVD